MRNLTNLKIQFLAEQTAHIPTVAKWCYEQWGRHDNKSTSTIIENLKDATNTDRIPLAVIAMEADIPLGVGLIKSHEMNIYPDKKYWLSGIYVHPTARGKGIAAQIITRLIEIAKALNIEKLYLQTEQLDGGLYLQMGWQKIEILDYHNTTVLVMELGT